MGLSEIQCPQIFIQHFTQFYFLKSYKIISKSDIRLEALMGNKISEKFILKNEGIITDSALGQYNAQNCIKTFFRWFN
jgi:hypothetical protein